VAPGKKKEGPRSRGGSGEGGTFLKREMRGRGQGGRRNELIKTVCAETGGPQRTRTLPGGGGKDRAKENWKKAGLKKLGARPVSRQSNKGLHEISRSGRKRQNEDAWGKGGARTRKGARKRRLQKGKGSGNRSAGPNVSLGTGKEEI